MKVGKTCPMKYIQIEDLKSFSQLKKKIEKNESLFFSGISAFISKKIHFNGNLGTFSKCGNP